MNDRQEFEAWYLKRFGKVDLTDTWVHACFCDRWEVWQAAVATKSPLRHAPLIGMDTKCLACGEHHYGLSGLPCPNMRVTAQ